MQIQITDFDLRSPDYKGFWMDLIPFNSKNEKQQNSNSKNLNR